MPTRYDGAMGALVMAKTCSRPWFGDLFASNRRGGPRQA
jgi:hypothetical protein